MATGVCEESDAVCIAMQAEVRSKMMRPETARRQHTRTPARQKERIRSPQLCQKLGKSRVLRRSGHRRQSRYAGAARKGNSRSRASGIPIQPVPEVPKMVRDSKALAEISPQMGLSRLQNWLVDYRPGVGLGCVRTDLGGL